MLTYVKMMENYISEHPQFTCQDIMRITNTTCPHNVVRSLRRKFKISFERLRNKTTGKDYHLYTCEGVL